MNCHDRQILFALMSLICVALSGCASQQGYTETSSNPIVDEFTAGRDREPTAQTLYAMSRLLVVRDREPQAEFVLTRVIERYPEYVPAYVDLAEIQMRRGATAEAMATLRAGLEIAPGNPVLTNNLGVCQMMDEDYPSALSSFTAASEAAPGVPRYRANAGVAAALMGDYDHALACFMAVHSPEDAHRNLAVICRANGDEARADEEFRLANKLQKP